MREVLNVRYEEAPLDLTETAKYLLDPELLREDLARAQAEANAHRDIYSSLRNQYLPLSWGMRVVNGHALKNIEPGSGSEFCVVSEVVTMGSELAAVVNGPRMAYIGFPKESELEYLNRNGYEVIYWEMQSEFWHEQEWKMKEMYRQKQIAGVIFEHEADARKAADLWVASGAAIGLTDEVSLES